MAVITLANKRRGMFTLSDLQVLNEITRRVALVLLTCRAQEDTEDLEGKIKLLSQGMVNMTNNCNDLRRYERTK